MLDEMVPETIFAKGIIPNAPDGLYMTNSNIGKQLLWVAQRGEINDWTIYVHWAENGEAFVINSGDKVISTYNIKNLVPCEEEAFSRYRF